MITILPRTSFLPFSVTSPGFRSSCHTYDTLKSFFLVMLKLLPIKQPIAEILAQVFSSKHRVSQDAFLDPIPRWSIVYIYNSIKEINFALRSIPHFGYFLMVVLVRVKFKIINTSMVISKELASFLEFKLISPLLHASNQLNMFCEQQLLDLERRALSPHVCYHLLRAQPIHLSI